MTVPVPDPAWRDLGVTPIAGADPFGGDPQYHPSFEAVEAEIGRLQTDPAGVDWGRVAVGAAEVLGQHGKDWRMACRLVVALYRVGGYEGLALGLGVLGDLMDESRWTRISPPVGRKKLRGAFLSWVNDQLTAGLEEAQEAPAAAASALTAAAARLEVIDRRAAGGLDDSAPVMRRLRASLQRLQIAALASAAREPEDRSAGPAEAAVPPVAVDDAPAPAGGVPPEPAQAPDPDAGRPPRLVPDPAVPAAAPDRSAPAGDPPRAVAVSAPIETGPALSPTPTAADPARALRELRHALLTLAAALRAQRSADPRPYAILRQALWMDLEGPPPDQAGVTQVPAPAAERLRLFEDLERRGDWVRLIAEVEQTLGAGSLFWLDAHRLVATALEALGADHGGARQAVVQSLGALLRRFPGLERLRFRDGAGGFADDPTLAWIAAEVVPRPVPAAAALAETAPWTLAAAQAAALAARGRLHEGLALFPAGIGTAGSLRERFFWELAQARACCEAGLFAVARLQLEALESQVGEFQLERWEPGLALEVARLYLAVAAPPAGGEGAAAGSDLQRRLFARLCRHDVAAALALNVL